jgi:hypothetical protein
MMMKSGSRDLGTQAKSSIIHIELDDGNGSRRQLPEERDDRLLSGFPLTGRGWVPGVEGTLIAGWVVYVTPL